MPSFIILYHLQMLYSHPLFLTFNMIVLLMLEQLLTFRSPSLSLRRRSSGRWSFCQSNAGETWCCVYLCAERMNRADRFRHQRIFASNES